jgi:membrane protease YdiL (CAAX protease family)
MVTSYAIVRPVHPVPLGLRWRKVLRGLLPGQASQLFPLLAAFCLSSCYGRSWLLVPSPATADALGVLTRDELYRWIAITQAFSFVLLLTAVGAYLCCLWPLNNPFQKWSGLVVFPALLGIVGGLLLPALVILSQRQGSVLKRHNSNPFSGFKFPVRALLLNLGTGFQLAALGLLLALATAWMLRSRAVSLPLRFGHSPAVVDDSPDSARSGQRLFTLYVLAFPGLAANLLNLAVLPLFTRLAPENSDSRTLSLWLDAAKYLVLALVFFLIAAWCLGQQRKRQLMEAARPPSPQLLGVASLIGLAAYFLSHLVHYGMDSIARTQQSIPAPDVPVVLLYVHIPPLGAYLVLIAIATVLSEWCWRGCVQPQFIRIFGVARGLFLVGILYGSVQQLSFPRFFPGLPGFLFNFLLMLVSGIAWSVVLGWLTIRAASVWPSAVCATLTNVLVWGSFDDTVKRLPPGFLRLGFLAFGAILAFLLVRYSSFEPRSQPPPLSAAPRLSETA